MLCYALKHRNINSSKCSCSQSYDRTILHHCVDSPFDAYIFAPISNSVHPLAPGVRHFKPWTEGETRMGIPGFNPLAEMGRKQSNTFTSIPYRIHIQLLLRFLPRHSLEQPSRRMLMMLLRSSSFLPYYCGNLRTTVKAYLRSVIRLLTLPRS